MVCCSLLISATELITRYYSNDKLAQCCFNVSPTSATLADTKPTFSECAVTAGEALTVNMCGGQLFPDPHGNTCKACMGVYPLDMPRTPYRASEGKRSQ